MSTRALAAPRRRWAYAPTDPEVTPGRLWHVGFAVWVRRHRILGGVEYAVLLFSAIGLASVFTHRPGLMILAVAVALMGMGRVGSITWTLYRQHGPGALSPVDQLLRMADVSEPLRAADLHVGTYRVSRRLAELLPATRVESIDVWPFANVAATSVLRQQRELERRPSARPRLRWLMSDPQKLPVADRSCDLVMIGAGIHQIGSGTSRQRLLAEAQRILAPGGAVLMYEHSPAWYDRFISGFEGNVWVGATEWTAELRRHFPDVQCSRGANGMNLFVARNGHATGAVTR